jgi:triacylglycerol esterase/lipase EstA (alpha/beta hydrolase family)
MRRRSSLAAAVVLFVLAVRRLARRGVDWEARFRTAWRGMVLRIDEATDRVGMIGEPMPGAGEGRPPVLLVGGYANDARSMAAIRRSLERDGFSTHALTLSEFGMGDLMELRDELRRAVERVRAETGAERVHVVGYSSGGFVARAAAQLDGGGHGIGRVVTVATANAGFDFGLLNRFVDRVAPFGLRQVRRGSEFLSALHDSREGADVVADSVRSRA